MTLRNIPEIFFDQVTLLGVGGLGERAVCLSVESFKEISTNFTLRT